MACGHSSRSPTSGSSSPGPSCVHPVAALMSRTVAPVANVVETRDLTAPEQDGWAVDYRIRRADGEEIHAEVRCWERAHHAAEQAANAEALAAIADRGVASALEYAELVESPAARGAVLISIWFDPADNGTLRRRVSYERPSG
jgi:hypothetical protein